MSDPITRVAFYDGQIVGADDLTSAEDYARDQMARHERYLHSWGIAFGLELNATGKTDAKGNPYKVITVTAGVAIDGRGREIVVPDDQPLSEDVFFQSNVKIQDDKAYYPVFFYGVDQTTPQPALSPGACNGGQPNRTQEGWAIKFGFPGAELDLDKQTAAAVSDGPGDTSVSDPWRVLLGFVQWDSNLKKFKGLSTDNNGIGRRYAGVRADEVISRSGTLMLRGGESSRTGVPAVAISNDNGGELLFGLQGSDGNVTPVLTVNSKGDVTATGKLSGAVAPGTVQVQSGVAFDGVQLPLPPGIAQADVDAGKVTLHIHVTPRLVPPDTASLWNAIPMMCFVDDARRVNCWITWFSRSTTSFTDVPALCDYVVIGSVPATPGSTP
jgi:hypothetical protein